MSESQLNTDGANMPYTFVPSPDDYKNFFSYIIFGFITAIISGLWIYAIMQLNIEHDTVFRNPAAAALIVGMITTSATVLFVVLTSTLFRGFMKEKMEWRRMEKEEARQEKMREYQRRAGKYAQSMGNGVRNAAQSVANGMPSAQRKQEEQPPNLGGGGWDSGQVR